MPEEGTIDEDPVAPAEYPEEPVDTLAADVPDEVVPVDADVPLMPLRGLSIQDRRGIQRDNKNVADLYIRYCSGCPAACIRRIRIYRKTCIRCDHRTLRKQRCIKSRTGGVINITQRITPPLEQRLPHNLRALLLLRYWYILCRPRLSGCLSFSTVKSSFRCRF